MNPTESANTIVTLEREIAALKERNQVLEYGIARLDKVRVDQSRLLEVAWAAIQQPCIYHPTRCLQNLRQQEKPWRPISI